MDLRGVLSALLSKYVTVAQDEVKVSLWKGQLELHDVQVQVQELRRVLPLNVTHGFVATLSVRVPWTRLLSQSVTLVGSGVRFQVAGGTGGGGGGSGGGGGEAAAAAAPAGEAAAAGAAGPPGHHAAATQEAAAILRQVKRRLKVELSDVLVVLAGAGPGQEVRVHAERLSSGPYGGAEEAGAAAAGEEEGEGADADWARVVRVAGLEVRAAGRTVLRRVAAELVLSFSGARLSYCNVVLTEELRLALSDRDVELLRAAIAALFRGSGHSDDSPPLAPSTPEIEILAEPPPPLPVAPLVAALAAPGSPSSSWTSAIWNYGKSWLSAAAAPPPGGLGSPAKRGGPLRPPSSGNLAALEAGAPPPPPPALPSWFRFELPLFCLELSRHVEVAVGGTVRSAPRPLLRLRLERAMVEFSHSSAALELIARLGALSACSLWEGGAVPAPVLRCEAADDADAVALDWVHRAQDRFAEVTVEPLELSPSAALVRELVLFGASVLGSEQEEEKREDIQEEEEEEEPETALSVVLHRPRLRVGGFVASAEQVRYAARAVACDGLAIAAVAGGPLLLPLARLSVDLAGTEEVLVEAQGTVALRVLAPELRSVLVAASEFADQLSDDLPDYFADWAPGAEEAEDSIAEDDGAMRETRSAPRRVSPSVDSHPRARRAVLVSAGRLCVHVVAADGTAAVADLLADGLRLRVADGSASGGAAGLVLLDRWGAGAGRVLAATFAADGEQGLLSARAYAQLADAAVAAEVLFASPAYRAARDAAAAAPPLRFTYSRAAVAARDRVPLTASSLKLSGLRVHADAAALARLAQHTHLGVFGLAAASEAHLARFAAVRLRWLFVAVKALRWSRRRLLSAAPATARHASWTALTAAAVTVGPRAPPCLPPWRELCIYLQAAAADAAVELRGLRVTLPGALEAVLEEGTAVRHPAPPGTPFGGSESDVRCGPVALSWRGRPLGRVGGLATTARAALNGPSTARLEVEGAAARFDSPDQLAELLAAVLVAMPPPREEVPPFESHERRSSQTVLCGPLSLSVGDFVATVGSMALADGTLSAAEAALEHRGRRLLSLAAVRRGAGGVLAASGLRVVVLRDSVEPLMAAAAALRPLAPPGKGQATALPVLLLRDSCFSLPLGKQSALHVSVSRLKGSPAGEMQAKTVCVYFGALHKLDIVVGGALKIERARADLAERELELEVGKVTVTLQPETDVDHLLFLLQHYELPAAAGADGGSARPGRSLRRVRVAESTVTVEAACLELERVELQAGAAWRLEVPAAALSFEGQTVAEATQLRVGARQPLYCERVQLSAYLSHFAGIRQLAARLTEARERLRDRGAAAAVAVAAQAPLAQRLHAPAALQGGCIPEIAVVLRPFPGFEPILQLQCRGLQSALDEKAGSSRFTLASAVGTVMDVFSGSDATFLEAEAVFVVVGAAEVHCGTERPVGLTLSLPLMRCVAALRQGRMEPVFPALLENLVGWPVIVGGSRRCEVGETVGVARPMPVQVLAGERVWCSAAPVDFGAIESKRVVEVESADGDVVDLVVSRTGENRFAIAGCTAITNASGLRVHILHLRPFRGVRVLNETVAATGRALALSSDKGKEEDEDSGPSEDSGSGNGVSPAPEVVHVMSTPKSAFKFRVAGSKWSEATVRPAAAVAVASGEGSRCVLVQCSASAFLWCAVQSPVALRLSAVCVLQNCLPCPLFWASVDGSGSGCVESGAQGSFTGHPDNAIFGLSVASLAQAQALGALVDCSRPRSAVAVSETLTLHVTCFTVSLTRTRHVQVVAPLVLCNQTSFPLRFGTHTVVAPHASVPCNAVQYTIGNSEPFYDGGDVFLEAGEQSAADEDSADALLRAVAFEEEGRTCEVLVGVRRDRTTRSLHVEARPWFEVANETRATLLVAQEGLGDARLEPGGRASLALWAAPERQRPIFRLKDVRGRACSEEVWAQFGTVRLVALGEEGWVVVRVHFRPTDSGFPRVIRVSLHEASPAPFAVRNDSPWAVAVQEQWDTDVCRVPPGAERALFPLFWRDYLEQQRESMDEALAALQADGAKGKAKQRDGHPWDLNFPASIRNKAFVFRVRLESGGNWSELLESSRPHFFSMPLYSERGSVSVNVAVAFVGLAKQICVGLTPPPALRPLTSWRVSVALVSVRAAGLAELLARGLSASRRGVALEVSVTELQVENQVPGALYPLLAFQTGRGRRPALLVRARLGLGPAANPLAKLFVALSDWGLELDYGSVKQLAAGLAAIFRVPAEAPPVAAAATAPLAGLMDELDFAPFSLLLSWQNPKLIIPVDVWDEMLSIRHLRLQMPGLSHSGCPLSRRDLWELFLGYVKEAFLGQTVRILGSLDVLGNPTGLVVAFGRSVRFLQHTWTAAVEGNGHAALEGATDAVRTFAGALMTPIVSFSNASARLVGEAGALGAMFDINRRTVEFVSGYFTDTAPPDVTQSPFKGK